VFAAGTQRSQAHKAISRGSTGGWSPSTKSAGIGVFQRALWMHVMSVRLEDMSWSVMVERVAASFGVLYPAL
jgi:hypothetical protein